MGGGEIVVTALGMATALGIGADIACAAARAGVSRARDLEHFLVPDAQGMTMVPLRGHTVGYHAEGFTELGRLARLGSLALADLLSRAGLEPGALDRTGFFAAAPSGYQAAMEDASCGEDHDFVPPLDYADPFTAARRAAYPVQLAPRIYALCRVPMPRAPVEVVLEDQAGFAVAAAAAMAHIERGAIDRAVVGGVDSLMERETLEALVALGLLKTPGSSFGMVPGEGAAFLLLERRRAADQRGRAPLAAIEAPAVVVDPDHQHAGAPPNGRALSAAIEQAAARLPGSVGAVGLLIGTHNGHPWTAAEWGRAAARLPRPLAGARTWRPAESFGETGAAAGAIGACLGAAALAKGYARADAIVVWMSAGRGGKGACALRAAS